MDTLAMGITGLIAFAAGVVCFARLHTRIDVLTKRLELLEERAEKLTIYLADHAMSTEHPWGPVIQYAPPQKGQPRPYRFPPMDEQR